MAREAVKSKIPRFSKGEVSEIANLLDVIANERRLTLPVEMIRSGETTVTSLAEAAGLSLSAAS